ncbi:MAG: DMT family transporter [candidate division Zixibacteria bacterium]|nr:DMT family transporter [candidate division Zixibacteria bacterium]
MPYVGEIAGLSTALFWAMTFILFSEAGKRIGSFAVNCIRLLLAVIIYSIVLTILDGTPWPEDLNTEQLTWLGLSGLIGLSIGDGLGFKALVMIGPRLTTLLYSTAPIMATIIAWVFLGEKLGSWDLLGIAVAIGGVSWVVMERQYSTGQTSAVTDDHPDKGSLTKGILLGLGAALGQAVGLVLAKQGMVHSGGDLSPMSASFIRMLVGLGGIWLLAIIRGQLPLVIRALKNRPAMTFCTGGAIVGPFLGVWLSLVAVKYIATGVAATLNSMTPIAVLPLLIWYYREEVSLRAWLGAILAVAGVTLIFLG